MQFIFPIIALTAVCITSAQYVTTITPTASAPAGCSTDYAGSFEITVVLPFKKRDIIKRQSAMCASHGTLVATLENGVLTDAEERIGAIVANGQFQFDGPPAQAGSIYTSGWSICNNESLALSGSSLFYQCPSGTFYNIYNQRIDFQCQEIIMDIIPCSNNSASLSPVTQTSDGQAHASPIVPEPISQFTDGQIRVTASLFNIPSITQTIGDQIQASSSTSTSPLALSLATNSLYLSSGSSVLIETGNTLSTAPRASSSIAIEAPVFQCINNAADQLHTCLTAGY